ncbi:MAG: alcohol dehydrogenase catalytic domain-containing protein [Nitrososphaerales archaeon]
MKALVFYKAGEFKLEKLEVPKPKEGEVLVKIKAGGVCATDLKILKGEKGIKSGTILGHEFSGYIAEVRGNVNLKIGDRVSVYPIIACGNCYFCIIGKRNRCLERKTLGIDVNGGFAQYTLIPKEVVSLGHILKLPNKVSYEEGALLEPLATVVNSMDALNLSHGESILIVGAGPMGLMHLILAKVRGASKIVVSDLLEDRLKLAKELGADFVINPREKDLVKEIKDLTGIGIDKAVVTVGSAEAVEQAINCVRSQGILNLFAGGGKEYTLNLDLNKIHYKEITLTGTQNATFDQYKRSLELVSSGRIKLKSLITHEFPLEEYYKAFDLKSELKALKVILKPND